MALRSTIARRHRVAGRLVAASGAALLLLGAAQPLTSTGAVVNARSNTPTVDTTSGHDARPRGAQVVRVEPSESVVLATNDASADTGNAPASGDAVDAFTVPAPETVDTAEVVSVSDGPQQPAATESERLATLTPPSSDPERAASPISVRDGDLATVGDLGLTKRAAPELPSSDSLPATHGAPVPVEPPPPPPPPPSPGEIVVAYVIAQLGKPYCYAGVGPDCFDCSGLTMMAWAQVGVFMGHNSEVQLASFPRVAMNALRPGDILWNPDHVGIYVGNGLAIHATHPGDVVRYIGADYFQAAVRPG